MTEELTQAIIALCGFTSTGLLFMALSICFYTISKLMPKNESEFNKAETKLMKEKAKKLELENKKTEMELYK